MRQYAYHSIQWNNLIDSYLCLNDSQMNSILNSWLFENTI